MSNGELYIMEILVKNGINFEREKTFSDLRGGLYRFDFYFPEKNICLEYDGEGHFSQIKKFYKNKSEFTRAQERDRRKNSYCLANKISLYRVPYWEIDNIKILDDIFKEKFLVRSKWHNDNLNRP